MCILPIGFKFQRNFTMEISRHCLQTRKIFWLAFPVRGSRALDIFTYFLFHFGLFVLAEKATTFRQRSLDTKLTIENCIFVHPFHYFFINIRIIALLNESTCECWCRYEVLEIVTNRLNSQIEQIPKVITESHDKCE